MTNKITQAMERIESLWYETNGSCYVSFSGGKDSTVILHLIKQCVELGTIPYIPALFFDTGIELEATLEFVEECKSWYPKIEVLKPKKSFTQIINEYGKPMKSKMKSQYLHLYQVGKDKEKAAWRLLNPDGYKSGYLANKDLHMLHPNFDIKVSSRCCEFLKKNIGKDYCEKNNIKGYILGERVAEGGVRNFNTHLREKPCTKMNGNYIVKLPIIDWSDNDIDSYINNYSVPLSKAYTDYEMKRTGCFCCPYNLNIAKDLETLYKNEPNRYKASLFWLKDVYIAQNVQLPFDEDYEKERIEKWQEYSQMRYEMMKKYRPEKAKQYEQTTLF